MKSVCVLGGCGTYGSRISNALVRESIPTIIAGRNQKKTQKYLDELRLKYPNADIKSSICDVNKDIKTWLGHIKPCIVINACGPYQISDYTIARACIELGIHYIDLADSRDFVNNIHTLHDEAISKHVMVISGASTVPGLSSAVVEKYKSKFKEIKSLEFGVTPGAKTPRGAATAKAILSYI